MQGANKFTGAYQHWEALLSNSAAWILEPQTGVILDSCINHKIIFWRGYDGREPLPALRTPSSPTIWAAVRNGCQARLQSTRLFMSGLAIKPKISHTVSRSL